MADYLANLNDQQNRSVTTRSQYVRVVAGAGSGKTRVLTTRVLYLVNKWGIDPSKILAITFTNKAANEMKQRIAKTLPEASFVNISTIHALGVRILREDSGAIGIPRNFTILDTDDQKSIIREAYKFLKLDSKEYTFNAIISYVSNNKMAGFDPRKAHDMAYSDYAQNEAAIYNYYVNRQTELNGLDFDDLLVKTVKLLKNCPAVKEKWRQHFQYILVDEFQDVDTVQYEMIKLLTAPTSYLYVVGDPDQTIYTWRGADVSIIMNFEKEFIPCETIVMAQNYRSTKSILSVANSVIKYNDNRIKKSLYTNNDDGSKITHIIAPNDEAESAFVVRIIDDLHSQNVQYKDCAVLYRSNYLSRPFEKSLIDAGIPYDITGGIRFYERAEIKDMLSYLRMLVSKDDLSYKRIINLPRRGIGAKTLDTLLQYGRKNKMSMYEASSHLKHGTKAYTVISKFNQTIENWIIRSKNMSLGNILPMILSESGYSEMLAASTDETDSERQQNINELISDIRHFAQTNPSAQLADYLSTVALYTDVQNDNTNDHVQLMTIHAAKGLEFDNVFVVGLSEGIFPSAKTMEEGIDGLEEERRLCYVALTRARQRLFLTESRGFGYVTSGRKTPSRFLEEMSGDLIKEICLSSNN